MIAIVELMVFVLSGCVFARSLFATERAAVRVWLGIVLGLTAMMWLPALFSFFLGFVALSQHLAAAACAIAAAAFALLNRRKEGLPPQRRKGSRLWLFAVIPLFLVSAYLLNTHTLSGDGTGSLYAGQSTFGDMCLHLGFITSLSAQGFFPPQYSILPGTPVGYPFLCDSISATMYVLGLPLRYAYMLPMLFALFAVFCGGFFLFDAWLKDGRKALVGCALFFLGGGFGFAYFMDNLRVNPENFTRIFTAFYETPTNLVDQNIRWVNPIVDLLIPQRATLFGWVLLFACLYLLYRAVFEDETSYFAPLGILAGALPMIHTHSFLALALISAVLFVRALVRQGVGALARFAPYIAIAAVLALPQLFFFTFRQSSSSGFLRIAFNWANETDNYLWFYIKNMGLVYLLLIPAFFSANRDSRAFYGSSLLLLAICEVVVFQPNSYDNNKLLFVWHLLGCGLVGGFLVDVYDRLRGLNGRAALAAIVLFFGVFGGLLTLGREAVSQYELFSPAHVLAADYIEGHTPADSIFLTADNHNNTVAALTGRNIVHGSSSYLYFHGVDNGQAADDVGAMFMDPAERDALLTRYKVDYIFVSDYERYNYAIDEGELQALYPVAFDEGDIQIYAVSDRARAGIP